MAFIDGDDPINGSLFSFQEWERMKNNWRGVAAPANIQPGMPFSSNVADRLYHMGTAALEEVVQLTRSRLAALFQMATLEIKQINAVCLADNVVCINNSVVFLATY
jgi:hypothetical protein